MKKQVNGLKPILSKAGQQLREQFDDVYIDRDRRSDGWIADARHVAAGTSDHIPDPKTGIVRAIDIDRDVHKSGKPDLMPYIADQIRLAAKRGEKRISYIIFSGRIASSRLGWRWRKYTGSNPHNHHCHVSFTRQGDEDGSFFQVPLLGANK
jgi:hypothetical protein